MERGFSSRISILLAISAPHMTTETAYRLPKGAALAHDLCSAASTMLRQERENRHFRVGGHIALEADAVILRGMTRYPEDIAMPALTSTQLSRNSEPGLHAFERAGQPWRGRRFSSFGELEQAENRARRDQCPRCRTVAAGPLASSHQGAGAITHHWQCEACELDWGTTFRALLV